GARAPAPWDAAAILSSPLVRARETATLLAGRAAGVRIEPALVEMDLGRWEGRRGVELMASPESGYRPIEAWSTLGGWAMRCPGGEGPGDVRARLIPLFERLAEAGGRAVLVTHMNVIRTALAWAHGWAFDGPAPFQIKRGQLYPLTLDRGVSIDRPPRAGGPIRLVAGAPVAPESARGAS
ncbi:MAG: histidine phosphatase family protein, partial [Pseudomonadota bacterium]